MTTRRYTDGKSDSELIGNIGFGGPVTVDMTAHKKVLITGAGSYIGQAYKRYAAEHYAAQYDVIDELDMMDSSWRDTDFSQYDIVYHVAGIAHADVGNVDEATQEKYYAVNTDLTVEVCRKAKSEGVPTFVFMSSMIVYGGANVDMVTATTVPCAANFYGDSKLQADVAVRELADDKFKVMVLRPPMIYGRGSKGNYPTLAKLAKKLPIFPDVDNKRSMLYIENLCEFLCRIMLAKQIDDSAAHTRPNSEPDFQNADAIVLIPQNPEYTRTAEMVCEIARVSGRKIHITKLLNPAVYLASKIPGKISGLAEKAFGSSYYDKEMSVYPGIDYQKVDLAESIRRTEG